MSENTGRVVEGARKASSAGRGTGRPKNRIGTLTSLFAGACVAVAAVAPAVVLATPAQAASAVGSCFNLDGIRVGQGLVAQLEVWTAAGNWAVVPGTVRLVDATGCANYTINPGFQGYNFRISAFGVDAALSGIFYGASLYSPAGSDPAWLGESALTFFVNTDPVPTFADEWLGDMATVTRRPTCESSPAAAVNCWMDANGLVGNTVVVPVDIDGDKVPADIDPDDRNPAIP